MANTTIAFGVILLVLGVGGYVAADGASITALIPAFFGLPLVILGALARKESRRKHVMHAAVVLGLLGFLGSAPGLIKLPALLSGAAERPLAVVMQSVMALLMALFVGLCVKSFIDARKARAAPQP